MANTYLSKTFGSAGNRKTWTVSFWLKKSTTGVERNVFSCNSLSAPFIEFRFDASDVIQYYEYTGSSMNFQFVSNQVLRDVNSWYHIVIECDTTQATASDRMKIYVNGSQITSFSTATYPSLNLDTQMCNSVDHWIGRHSSVYLDGLLTHFHLIDGTAYDASAFGETDSTTGIWKPKTAPSVTYGTNGFFLKFENSGSMGTDSSGNANNFTVNGTMTQTVDTPSNVFATLNPLDNYYCAGTLSNGNNTVLTDSSRYGPIPSTLRVSSGKYYCEVKNVSGIYNQIGILGSVINPNSFYGASVSPDGYIYYAFNGNYINNATSTSYGNTYTNGDIIGIALDLDNNKLYFSKNGTWQNSGDPTSGATGTGAISIVTPTSGTYAFVVSDENAGGTGTFQFNFGNGYFGTTAVSSAQNPDDGIGIFEYDVPAGYRALCTKSINAQEYS